MIQIDINKPTNCDDCPFCVDYDCIIHDRITHEYYDSSQEQYQYCPIIGQTQGWIPTKIAKPPKAGQYLVTKQQKTGVRQIATAYYNPSFDEWSGNGNFTKVLAWQQLPTPYTQE